MNLYQELLQAMDNAERLKFMAELGALMRMRSKLHQLSVFECLKHLTQEDYDEALDKSGLPLGTRPDGTLFLL